MTSADEQHKRWILKALSRLHLSIHPSLHPALRCAGVAGRVGVSRFRWVWVWGVLAPPAPPPLLYGASNRRGEAAAHETTSAEESQRSTDQDGGGGMEGWREVKKGRNQREASSKWIKVKKGGLAIYLCIAHLR